MNPILIAILSVTCIGILCAVMLVVASKVMAVKEDERIAQVRACLPGANCGACGYAGCDGYAKALIEDGAKTNLCIPGADAVSQQISSLLGVEFEDVIEQVAVVKCRGDNSNTADKMEYYGEQSCRAAKLFYGGRGRCTYGCLGFGDCAKVCPQEAICIENGMAHVDIRKCIGCGMCAKECPNGLLVLRPDVIQVLVTCSNHEKGANTRKECTHGCIGCGKCARECPVGAIQIIDNLAKIDHDACTGCGHCAEVCVTGCIIRADYSGAHRMKQA